MARKYHQGKFTPTNPSKYVGDVNSIFYRSSWEKKAMIRFDEHPDVIKWQSEELVIPYFSPVDNRKHRYFTDFSIMVKNRSGEIKRYVVEVKPYLQTLPPKIPKKQSKSYIESVQTFLVNTAKWKAAREWCSKNGFEFQILTENELFGDKK